MELINGKGTMGIGDPRYREGKLEQLLPLKGVQMQIKPRAGPAPGEDGEARRKTVSSGAFL